MVSLPSEWVKAVGLKPGDIVRIEVRDDGSLIVTPVSLLEKRLKGKEVTIRINHATPEEILVRTIYAMYIAGYDRIIVESSEPYILGQQLHAVRNIVRMLIGSEIVEQTANRIVIQVFVDVERYSLDNLIHRMLNTLKSMLDFLTITIVHAKPEHLGELQELEYELDRVYALSVRYTYVLSTLRCTPFLTEYRTLIKSLEDIGDALTMAANALKTRPSVLEKLSKYMEDRAEELKNMFFYVLDLIYEALTKNEVFVASKAVDLSQEVTRYVSKLEESLPTNMFTSEELVAAKHFFEKFKLVGNYLQGAAELAFDIALEKAGNLINLAR